MVLRYVYPRRRPLHPSFGSAALFTSQRLAPGSTLTTDDLATDLSWIKTLAVRGNRRGSYFIDVAFAGTEKYFTIANGTFPGGQGSIKLISFEEAVRRSRVRILAPNIAGSVGSYSVYYGGFHPTLT